MSCSAASRGELGLRRFLEQRGHRLIVTSDKDGADSVFERELPDAEIVISQPFWPAYLTAERIAKVSGDAVSALARRAERQRRYLGWIAARGSTSDLSTSASIPIALAVSV